MNCTRNNAVALYASKEMEIDYEEAAVLFWIFNNYLVEREGRCSPIDAAMYIEERTVFDMDTIVHFIDAYRRYSILAGRLS